MMTSTTAPAPTAQDVADRAGVSVRTVGRVIHDPALVKADVREAVEAVIEELGYVPQPPRKGPTVPLDHQVAIRVDDRTHDELARRGALLAAAHGPRTRGYDAEVTRLALDWAFNPPEGVDPMPDGYLGFVDRVSSP